MRDLIVTLKNSDVFQYTQDTFDEYHITDKFFQVWFDGALLALFNNDEVLKVEFIDLNATVICKE